MNERDIEEYVKKYAKAKGCYVRKFTSPSHRAVPDDIFIYKGTVWFIEFKAPGKKPTEAQKREGKKIWDQGVSVYYCDDREEGKRIVDGEMALAEMVK